MSDPAKFVADNFATNLNLNGSIWGMAGVNANKVGVTIIPTVQVDIAKPANSLGALGVASGQYSGVVTLGKSFSLSAALPELHVGTNLKYISGMFGIVIASATGNGSETYGSTTGFGVDLGALMTFDIPAVTSLSVGLVIRDLAETITSQTKSKTLSPAPGGQGFVEGVEQDLGSSTRNVDSSYAIGVSGKVPVVGLLAAMDLESGNGYSNTHLGFEYPLILNMLALRAGVASGTNLSLTTLGAKISIPVFAVNVAMINDNKNSNNNSYVIDFGAAL
jgi:hypothetical protein